MVILGISYSHDGTLTVLRDGKIVYAVGEERLNRIKAYIGFPFMALRDAVRHGVFKPEEVEAVTIPLDKFPVHHARAYEFVTTEDKQYVDIQNDYWSEDNLPNLHKRVSTEEECRAFFLDRVKALFEAEGIRAPIYCFNHHHAHAASAYYASGKEKILVITMDGEGDGLSGTVSVCDDGKITRLHTVSNEHSLGYVYAYVTRYCGFKIGRHEGKITGLAAFGNPDVTGPRFNRYIRRIDGDIRISAPWVYRLCKQYPWLSLRISANSFLERCARSSKKRNIADIAPLEYLAQWCSHGAEMKDIAAGMQENLENVGSQFVDYWVKKTGISDVAVAGGIFANVKLNQRISELKGVSSLFVYPNMGDGGLAYGSAALLHYEKHAYVPKRLANVYYGEPYDDTRIEGALRATESITWERHDDICEPAAALIAEGKIVGWFQGAMEYGPRALGNRSILASPVDRTINDWLNKKLRRTEFMPFAPSCLYEFADEVFEIPKDSLKYTAEFMTITFTMKKHWAERGAAVAHVDRTARPQLVTKEANPLYHRLLSRYYDLTGLPFCVNTSFNIHEEPIVNTPEEAIKPLLDGVIYRLVLGNYIIKTR